jgi:dethiobiotin synthase
MKKNILNRFKLIFNNKRGYFVTATDTNVGKTYCSAIVQKALDAVYFKPIQAGDIESGGDTRAVQKINSMPDEMYIQPIYNLKYPLSPHHSAFKENIEIDIHNIKLPETNYPLVVEGAGGVLVPINKSYFMIDVIKKFNLPVILVVRTSLGTLNHTLLTLEALRKREISIEAILFNGEDNPDNYQTLVELSGVTHIIKIPTHHF